MLLMMLKKTSYVAIIAMESVILMTLALKSMGILIGFLEKVKTNKGQNNKRPFEVKVANIIDDEPCVVIVATRKVDHIELGELLSK